MSVGSLNLNTSLIASQAGDSKSAGSIESLVNSAKSADKSKVDKVAKEFEAVFMAEMLNNMFGEVTPDENFGGGFAEEMWSGVLRESMGKQISQMSNNGLGISNSVMKEMLKMQEVK